MFLLLKINLIYSNIILVVVILILITYVSIIYGQSFNTSKRDWWNSKKIYHCFM